MAALFHSNIDLVYAVEDPLPWYGAPDPIRVLEVDIPRVLRESEERLRGFAATHFQKMDAAIHVALRGPLELIEATAGDARADLIMMPTHGRGRFRSALLGSVTAKVLHDLKIPVWTDAHAQAPADHWPVRTVACAIDLSAESAQVLRFAADFANRCAAQMFVVHGVPVAEMRLGAYSKIKPPVYMADFARAEIEKLQREAGTAFEIHVDGGPIASVVRDGALQRNADLVVIGRGLISGSGHLAAHAYSIIREAPCPVLSL